MIARSVFAGLGASSGKLAGSLESGPGRRYLLTSGLSGTRHRRIRPDQHLPALVWPAPWRQCLSPPSSPSLPHAASHFVKPATREVTVKEVAPGRMAGCRPGVDGRPVPDSGRVPRIARIALFAAFAQSEESDESGDSGTPFRTVHNDHFWDHFLTGLDYRAPGLKSLARLPIMAQRVVSH